jgi:hypothetical protein
MPIELVSGLWFRGDFFGVFFIAQHCVHLMGRTPWRRPPFMELLAGGEAVEEASAAGGDEIGLAAAAGGVD